MVGEDPLDDMQVSPEVEAKNVPEFTLKTRRRTYRIQTRPDAEGYWTIPSLGFIPKELHGAKARYPDIDWYETCYRGALHQTFHPESGQLSFDF